MSPGCKYLLKKKKKTQQMLLSKKNNLAVSHDINQSTFLNMPKVTSAHTLQTDTRGMHGECVKDDKL